MVQTLVCFISTLAFVLLLTSFILGRRRKKNLPPGPPSLPIIGHLHLLKQPIHRTLQQLSNKYDPIVSLSFGNRNVLIVSSPALTEECLTKNDIVFANRPQLPSFKHLSYDYTTLAFSSYGDHWRNLRRFASTEFFSTSRLNAFLSIRQDEVRILLRNLYKISGKNFTKVELKSRLKELSFNIIMRMVAGKRYFTLEAEYAKEGKQFRDITDEVFELVAAGNPTDFVPVLKWIDFNGKQKRLCKLQKEADELCQALIDEHRNKQSHLEASGETKTMIDAMLALQESEPECYSDDIIKGMILTMVAGGTDTSAVTLEWAMSLLLNHPEVLEKAKDEINNVIGNEKLVEESDYSKFPYLQSIVKETLRVYPTAPLLLPRQNSVDCDICGYHIPKDTILLISAYAIHRDSKVWDDPMNFRPERFEGVEIETYKLLSFGAGRRACPGSGLGNRVVGFALSSLIQCFEWKRLGEMEIDMTEGTGATMPKFKPLEAICRARESMINVLNTL